MTRRLIFALALGSLLAQTPLCALTPLPEPHTVVSIAGEDFHINGRPTYEGRTRRGHRIEGLLMNSRMVQSIFDDRNPETVARWAYPDTGKWDAERNTREFIAAMPEWRRHGLLAFTLNLQGGSPQGYSKEQPWHNSAFEADGSLRGDYLARIERILKRADELGMVVILGYFYFGQDERLTDEAAVLRAVDAATDWLLLRGWRNVLVEVNNECNVRYDHAILQPERVHELIERVKARTHDGRRLLVGTSYGGGTVPKENVVRASDFLLLHGNGVKDPARIAEMVRETRKVPGYTPKPILFNEDDHFNFEKPTNNFIAAVSEHASWGYFDFRMAGEKFDDGYQSVPVNWGISSGRKRGFFRLLAQITGAPLTPSSLAFRHHFIDRDLPGDSYGQSSLVDVDCDGDLDFITGGRDREKTVYWFEFQSPQGWTRHVLGVQHPSDVGGAAFDVNSDDWPDHVTGGVWYRNTGKPRTESFQRFVFDAELTAVHDLVVADLDDDGRRDVITMSDKNNLRWYRIPADPRHPWQRHDIGPGVHAGAAAGDIDGDGDLDVARSNAWFENADAKGLRWVEHPIPFGTDAPPFPFATRCVITDINRDGRNDLVMTENEIRAGRIAWLENTDGRGIEWKTHELVASDPAPRGAYHSLAVADFDGDGDGDVFTVEMEAIAGVRPPRWFIWENVDGKGASFVERVILDAALGGHEAIVGDVDGDGDLDICSKLWRPRKDNANEGRNHADFLENRRIVRAD